MTKEAPAGLDPGGQYTVTTSTPILPPGDHPPHSADAEADILTGLMNGSPMPEGLTADHFYVETCGELFAICSDLVSRGLEPSEPQIRNVLEQTGRLMAIGGISRLTELEFRSPAADLQPIADRIVALYRQRESIRLGRELARTGDPDAVLARLQELRAPRQQTIIEAPQYPTLDPGALHGLAGEIVAAIEPHTESDPVAILAQFLAAFGSCAGRGPYTAVEADRHGGNESEVLVGRSSRARKGTSWRHVRRLFDAADPEWVSNCIVSGLSSGEGLIWAVRDPITKIETPKDGIPREVIVDEGVTDKRLLVIESEYASVLKVMSRRGNTISPVIRDAWDGYSLRSLVKNSPATATDPHITILGHITAPELKRELAETEAANGYGNRVLWLCVRRSKVLPEGGSLSLEDLAPYVQRLRSALEHSRRVGELRRNPEARALWAEIYPRLSADIPGLLGAMVARAEAHVTRLSLLYALLDESSEITVEHLLAALAFWQYAEDSCRYIFGDSLGDPVADRLLELIRDNPEGITQTELHNALGNNYQGSRINTGLSQIEGLGLALVVIRKTSGRPARVWYPAVR